MSLSNTPSFRRMPTVDQIKAEHTITLRDQTFSASTSQQDRLDDAERQDSDSPSSSSTPAVDSGGLYHRLTNNSANIQQSVRRELAKQKYYRYRQDKYDVCDTAATTPSTEDISGLLQGVDEPTARGYLERAQTRARAALRRKKALGRGKDEQSTVVDVLYENQRGVFFFGIPKYSSKSLLPTDPKPWQNAQFRTSASDIRNAQLPDPSWEWAWKSWYVDMSRDVDEEGWEYCFAFAGQGGSALAWHGNHPWFNSFVRRRRWLRVRKRRDLSHHTRERAHELTADYFTIHPKTVRPSSLMSGQNRSSTLISVLRKVEESEDVGKMEVTNIGDLFLALRKATVDRERLSAVRRFTDDGGDELIYLSERMDGVMGMFIFQNSRRQLLSDLISRHEGAHEERKELAAHDHEDDEEKQKAHDRAARHADYLLRAVHAADAHVKRLEYWSDMKDVSASAVGIEREEGHDRPSFLNKQEADDGAPELHKHPEHRTLERRDDATSNMANNNSGVWYDAVAQQPTPPVEPPAEETKNSSEGSELERFSTPAEFASDISDKSKRKSKGKGKGQASKLDGVQEEDNSRTIPDALPAETPGDDAGSHAAGP